MTLVDSDLTLSLLVGESFVEAQVSHKNKQLKFTRWYLGKDSLRGGLQKFLQEGVPQKIQKVVVASRFLEKILTYRLGGSVAVVTTQGFENWAALREPPKACNKAGASKFGPLSSPELYFSIAERCDAHGHIEQELSETAIQELVDSLRAKQAKRVCIHFLNATANPANQNKLAERLKQDFDVFLPTDNTSDSDEVSRWRQNILNASLSGTFEEVQEEINDSLKDFLVEGVRARFFSSEGVLFDRENQYRLSSLWGASHAWIQALKARHSTPFQVLHLGLEQFSLLNPQKLETHWKSPWGRVHAPQVQQHLLSLQPTTQIEMSEWGTLSFSQNLIGYEPGPMFMGRGQVPCLLDLWAEELGTLQGVGERCSSQGRQKFKNQLWALNKISKSPFSSEEKAPAALREFALQKLALDFSLRAGDGKVICLGALAPLFGPELQRRLPHLKFEILPETETSFLMSQG